MARIDKNNINDVPEGERALVTALLMDIDEINSMAPGIGFYIVRNNDENDDYYGTYRVKTEKMGEAESIGMEMSLPELDSSICVISDTVEAMVSKTNEQEA